VQRVLKLARYLPRFGWRAHVVCCGHTQYPLLDRSLSSEAGNDAIVYRTCGLEPGGLTASMGIGPVGPISPKFAKRLEDGLSWRLQKMLSRTPLPEHELLWLPAAIRQSRQIAANHPIEAVITSGPPHCTHWVGESLKRRLGLPWIADLRDPILDNWARANEGAWRQRYWQWLERAVASRADRIVVTCQEAGDRLMERYTTLGDGKVQFIPNGFDPEDAPQVVSERSRETFRLAHVGAFYREQSVGPILEALRIVRQRCDGADKALRFDLIGSLSTQQRGLIQSSDSAFLRHIGYLPHAEATAAMASADALVLMTPSNPSGRYCIPAKTFEYLAFGQHIIAMVHPGTMLARMLAEAGNTSVIHTRAPERLADAIQCCFENWRDGRPQASRRQSVVDRFRRDRQVQEISEILDHCADLRPRLRLVRGDAEAVA
jgi:glycosyltransferase involved in cell wall biosynthesis